MNTYLDLLLKKYDVAYHVAVETTPLQPWRCNRRFVELAKLVETQTIEDVCLLRFMHMSDQGTSLDDLLYREFDLCEYLGKGKIVSLHAVFTDGCTGNAIVKLDNGVIASIEVGNNLPDGKSDIDRHEIIARRGVANDIPVDVQIPLQSIYTFTTDGENGYRDVDFELYGLSELEIEFVRAAFEFCKDPSSAEAHSRQDAHLQKTIKAAFDSNVQHKRIDL